MRQRFLLPFWLTNGLVFLGGGFVTLPLALALDAEWLYYALGLGVGGFIALHARNAYRMTILARGFGFAVIRIDYRPAADEAAARARAEARGGAE